MTEKTLILIGEGMGDFKKELENIRVAYMAIMPGLFDSLIPMAYIPKPGSICLNDRFEHVELKARLTFGDERTDQFLSKYSINVLELLIGVFDHIERPKIILENAFKELGMELASVITEQMLCNPYTKERPYLSRAEHQRQSRHKANYKKVNHSQISLITHKKSFANVYRKQV